MNGHGKRATLKEVAKLAEVSTATVSRYINGQPGRMSKKTAARIKAAVEQLNYVPNAAARQMVQSKSKMVAVVVADIDDYFSTELFKGASSILEADGYTAFLLDANASSDREAQLLTTVNEHNFDGLLLQPLTTSAAKIRERLSRQFPVVILDRELARSVWPRVVTNNYEVSRRAMDYFMRTGFKRAVVLSSPLGSVTTRRERLAGIRDAGARVDLMEIDEGVDQLAVAQTMLREKLSRLTEKTVLFALKESWLLKLLPTLMQEGLVNPDRVQVTGFADTDLIKAICPFAKMISQNPFLMGATAAEMLVATLNGPKQEAVPNEVIPAKFMGE